jgi:hypothetical protein
MTRIENAAVQATFLIGFAMRNVLSVPDFRNTALAAFCIIARTSIDFSQALCRINMAVATGVHETFPIGFVIGRKDIRT